MPGLLSSSNANTDVTTPAKPIGNAGNADNVADFLKPDANTDDTKDKPNPFKSAETDDKKKETKPKDKADKTEEEHEIEDDEIELKTDDEEEIEDKLDLKADDTEEEEIQTPPKKQAILKKYPDLFKEFPWFEKMMFRDRQYTELFGSFDDAKEIAERAQNLAEFEGDLLGGNIERTLASVKNADPKAFDKIVDSYLTTLAKVDREAYFEVVGNFSKDVVVRMINEAKSTGNEDLHKAGSILYQYLFGTSQFTPPTQRTKREDSDEKKQLDSEREAFARERFTTVRQELQTKIDNTLKATIAEYIDPKGEMSSYVKKTAIRDALAAAHEAINSDPNFVKRLNSLWEASFGERFSQSSVKRIQSTYLGRSKNVLATVIKKIRAEALKDSTPSRKVTKDDSEEETPRTRRGPINTGRPSQSSGSKLQMQKGESVADFFARD